MREILRQTEQLIIKDAWTDYERHHIHQNQKGHLNMCRDNYNLLVVKRKIIEGLEDKVKLD